MIFPRCKPGSSGVVLFCITSLSLLSGQFKVAANRNPVALSTPFPSPKNESAHGEHPENVKNDTTGTIVDLSTTPKTDEILKSDIIEGNSSTTSDNSTSMNYIIEYKPQVFDSPEDIKTQQEWGGNCTLANWDSCKVLATWFGKYEDPKDGEIKEYEIDCREEPVVCLRNSWTVTRCNLLCMSRCNREIQYKYDKYVSHSGECKAHAHG